MSELPQRRRVIRASSDEAANWLPPDLQRRATESRESEAQDSGGLPTAAQLEELTKQAHQEGYERGQAEGFEFGHREGLEAGHREMQERLQRFDEVLGKLEKPFEDLDEQVEREVVTLVIAMVRQLVRREVKTDPGQVVGVVREALGVLPVNARRIRVLLHPDDAELVREAYSLGENDQKWQIVEDPVIQRGGCRIYTENSQIDATLESRLNSLIAPLLANERNTDSPAASLSAKPDVHPDDAGSES